MLSENHLNHLRGFISFILCNNLPALPYWSSIWISSVQIIWSFPSQHHLNSNSVCSQRKAYWNVETGFICCCLFQEKKNKIGNFLNQTYLVETLHELSISDGALLLPQAQLSSSVGCPTHSAHAKQINHPCTRPGSFAKAMPKSFTIHSE